MKFWEAIKALEEEKKVRCKEWPKDDFLTYITPASLVIENADLRDLASKEWEIYEEPKQTFSFFEIVQEISSGKRFKRPKWPNGMSFGKTDYGSVRINFYEGETWELTLEDYQAKDWEKVKK